MKRILAFSVLLVVFLVWTFPHRSVVERMLKSQLAEIAVDLRLGEVALAWPPGYRVHDLVATHDPYGLTIDSLHFDLLGRSTFHFEADACGGLVRGTLDRVAADAAEKDSAKTSGKRLEFIFTDADPARCLRLADLRVTGNFGGELRLDGVGKGDSGSTLGSVARSGSLVIEGRSGTISGNLPSIDNSPTGKKVRAGAPIGEWTFTRAALTARLANGDVIFENAQAQVEGLAWELTKGRVQLAPGSQVRVNGDLRVRSVDDTPRSKGILGMLPKAGEDEDGWRHYRLAGSLDAPRIVGLK